MEHFFLVEEEVALFSMVVVVPTVVIKLLESLRWVVILATLDIIIFLIIVEVKHHIEVKHQMAVKHQMEVEHQMEVKHQMGNFL